MKEHQERIQLTKADRLAIFLKSRKAAREQLDLSEPLHVPNLGLAEVMDQEATNLEKRELAKTNRLSKAFLTVKKTKGVTSRRIKSDNPRTQQAREQVIGKKCQQMNTENGGQFIVLTAFPNRCKWSGSKMTIGSIAEDFMESEIGKDFLKAWDNYLHELQYKRIHEQWIVPSLSLSEKMKLERVPVAPTSPHYRMIAEDLATEEAHPPVVVPAIQVPPSNSSKRVQPSGPTAEVQPKAPTTTYVDDSLRSGRFRAAAIIRNAKKRRRMSKNASGRPIIIRQLESATAEQDPS